MFNRNGWKVLGFTLALLNIFAVARADTGRDLRLTSCQSSRVLGCVLPTLTDELVAPDLSRISLISSVRVDQWRATVGAIGSDRLRPDLGTVRPRTTTLFDWRRTIGQEPEYFGQETKELEREKPLSLDPYQTFIKTSRVVRGAVLRIKRAF